MASLLSPSRPGSRAETTVSLRATEAVADRSRRTDPGPAAPPVAWWIVALFGGLTVAVASWILAAGLTVLGWLAASPGTLAAALSVGTDLWLLGNGVAVALGPVPVTLVPWGSAALTAWMLSRAASLAARRVRPTSASTATAVARVTLVSLLAYTAPVVVLAVLRGEAWRAPLHWAAVLVVLAVAAAWGGIRVLDRGPASDPGRWWRALPRALPRAVLAAQLLLLAGGAALLTTSLVLHLPRVVGLTGALRPGVSGGIALLLGQLAYAPNALVFAAAYGLGGGFVLGSGSLVAPAGTELGVLPGVPILGALPAEGPGALVQLWWLGTAVLAGGVAAWILVRLVRRGRGATARRLRPDETTALGGLAGVLAGACFLGLGWAAGGDVGSLRLAGLGPRLLPLLVMAGTTLGLAGLITGLVLGVLPQRRRRTAT